MDEVKWKEYWPDFSETIKKVGVKEGSVIYVGTDATKIVYSAIKELRLKGKEESELFIDTLVDTLQEVVTNSGTILFPVYSWDFCKGKSFDYKKTQGEVGAICNYILNNRSDFIRTRHPMYSLMVWGKDAELLAAMDNQNAWVGNTPYAYMHKNNAIELDLSVDTLRSMTFKHYVEESIGVPYRHTKFFLGDYIDRDGIVEKRAYSMYVRDLNVQLESCQNDVFYINGGTATKVRFHDWDVIGVELGKAYDLMKDDFFNNGGKNIYRFTDYEIDWNSDNKVYEIRYLEEFKLM